MMWQSKDDIIKDLAFLNDFGVPGDEEPYKVLNSLGRGSKIKEKSHISKNFLDSRTGELININDEVGINAPIQENKGRGSQLGSYLRKKTQLQEQLRLARPLGSGDAAIESYCRRNISSNNSNSSEKSSDSEAAIHTTSDLKFDKTKQRIKAVRNSSLQSNALISNLLSKTNTNSDYKEISSSYDNCWCSSIDPNKKEPKIAHFGPEENKVDEQTGFPEIGSCDELKKQINAIGLEDFKINNSDEKNAKEREIECCATISPIEDAKQKEEQLEKYKRLGEIINGSSEIISKNYVKKMQHFNQSLKYIAQFKTDSDLNSVFSNNSDGGIFVYNEDEFPPLGKP